MKKSAFTALFPLCFMICLTMSPDLTGKWTGSFDTQNGPINIAYDFKVDGEKLTGTLSGPQGSIDLQNGSYKDSVLAFDITLRDTPLHQTGKCYGDSVVLDFKVRDNTIHIKLLKGK